MKIKLKMVLIILNNYFQIKIDFDSIYSDKMILNNKNSKNIFIEKDDDLSISSNNLNDKRKFFDNNNEDNNRYGNLKFQFNEFNNNTSLKYNQNKYVPAQNNIWEDSIHSKFKNLELTNDDLDEMFNDFKEDKKINFNKK